MIPKMGSTSTIEFGTQLIQQITTVLSVCNREPYKPTVVPHQPLQAKRLINDFITNDHRVKPKQWT
jgi:hypothetical protein